MHEVPFLPVQKKKKKKNKPEGSALEKADINFH